MQLSLDQLFPQLKSAWWKGDTKCEDACIKSEHSLIKLKKFHYDVLTNFVYNLYLLKKN